MLFTPRISKESGHRVEMDISEDDGAKALRGVEWNAIVTDRKSGLMYEVEGAPCGLPECFCDAVIVKLV